jgi:hypothetical protein
MVYMMLLAHLLGDYVLQWNALARWKARSVYGVLAHSGVVAAVTLLLAVIVDPGWWMYALYIGISHAVIDVVRPQLLRTTNPTWEMVWYLGDQVLHLAVIGLALLWGGDPWQESATSWLLAQLFFNRRILIFALGYLLLAQPSWVLLRMLVRGIGGPEAAPNLAVGEKYGAIVERLAIATFTLGGFYFMAPLVLLPRRMSSLQIQDGGVGVLVLRSTGSWVETLLSMMLAMAVGLLLRTV